MLRPSVFPKDKATPTIFNRIENEVKHRAEQGQKIHAMHVGDTYFDFPPAMTRSDPDEEMEYGSKLNRYGDTFGDLPLRKILLEKLRNQNKLPIGDIDSIQITCGATGALAAGFSRLADPGSEILVLAPYWTILRQVAAQAQVQIIEVPFFDKLLENEELDIGALLEEYGSPWCSGIYINTPSNPTGMLLKEKHLESIAAFAKKRDLWVFSDEAYEDFIFDKSEHVSIGSLPDMFDRTISVYTFSKNLGTSGMRVGYLAAKPSVAGELNKAVVGSCYHVSRIDQRMAWRGMKNFDECFQPLFEKYSQARDFVTKNLKAKFMPVSGSFYFFLWLGDKWKNIPSEEKVKRMMDLGVVLSPGESFGSDYNGWARMCFTILTMDELKFAVASINKMIQD